MTDQELRQGIQDRIKEQHRLMALRGFVGANVMLLNTRTNEWVEIELDDIADSEELRQCSLEELQENYDQLGVAVQQLKTAVITGNLSGLTKEGGWEMEEKGMMDLLVERGLPVPKPLADLVNSNASASASGNDIPDMACPYCGEEVDTAHGLTGNRRDGGPRDGDFTVCAECGQLGRFKEEAGAMSIQKSSDEEALPYIGPRGLIALQSVRALVDTMRRIKRGDFNANS